MKKKVRATRSKTTSAAAAPKKSTRDYKAEHRRRRRAVEKNKKVGRPASVDVMLGAALLLIDPEVRKMMEALFGYLHDHKVTLHEMLEAARHSKSYRRVLPLL